MSVKTLIKKSEYHDSVTLMLAARELSALPGIGDAAVVMGTEANKGLLQNAGLLTPEVETATPNDLVIAVNGPPELLEKALVEAEKILQVKHTPAGDMAEFQPKTLRGAVKANPSVNLAVISVSGQYAAAEAWDALHQGLHVLLFSDNVSLEDEITLKRYAVQHGLLLMGPGAGTAIINGVGLGFANAVPRGPVGLVSAAGTGLQEVSTLLAKRGIGTSQAIGTGGRDLKEEVGGLMMLAGLQALQQDEDTRLIVLISKPPAERVVQKVVGQAAVSPKPTVICFLGGQQPASLSLPQNIYYARTLEEAANQASSILTGQPIASTSGEPPLLRSDDFSRSSTGRCVRGLFSGGTLCYETQVIWRDLLAEPVFSNAPLEKVNQLKDSIHSQGHSAIDLGEEEFTVGRPHPMIDNDLRIRRLLQEASDPATAVIMLDVVIGYGAHPDPASELAPAIRQAIQKAGQGGRTLAVVASVTGTEADPQCVSRQVQALEAVGVKVCESNAAAARLAARLVAE